MDGWNRAQSIVRGYRPRFVAGVATLALLASCGGGGGGGNGGGQGGNSAPVFTSAASASFAENGTGTAYQATATDADGNAITFSISGGADAARFAITPAGVLTFVAPPNYDLPTDADGNNVYLVQLTASDGTASATLTLSVTVTNSKEGIAVHRVATGFASPVAISAVAGGELIVAEKAGGIFRYNPQTGVRTQIYLVGDIAGGAMIGLATGADFATSGSLFLMYRTGAGTLFVRHYLRNPNGVFDSDGGAPILRVDAPQYAGGGWLGMDAGGNLVIATSDAGGSGDPTGSAQSDNSRLGKILRALPNPDVGNGPEPAFFLLSPVAKGVHRPAGGGTTPGGVLVGDRGQDTTEEINLIETSSSGVINFGWPFKEGTAAIGPNPPPSGLTDPAIAYPHGTGARAGNAIVGGTVAGNTVASLNGQYVFGDGGGAIFSVPAASIRSGVTLGPSAIERRDADFTPDAGMIDQPVAIVRDAAGTLYILDGDGEIFRVDAG